MPWFAVRHVISYDGGFEERITLWERDSVGEATSAAEREAREWAGGTGGKPLDLFQSYELFKPPGDGTECFSLIRDSSLDPSAYADRFFDTGAEHQRHLD